MKFSYYKIGLLVLMIIGISVVLGLAVDLLLNHQCPEPETVYIKYSDPPVLNPGDTVWINQNDSLWFLIIPTNPDARRNFIWLTNDTSEVK